MLSNFWRVVGRVINAKSIYNFIFNLILSLLYHNFAQRPRPIFPGLDLAKFSKKKFIFEGGVFPS